MKAPIKLTTKTLQGQTYNACEFHKPQPVQTWQWACMTSFQLVYSFVNTGMGLFVLPAEAERLNGDSASVWVGRYLALCGATQLVCPLAGKISDKFNSRFGKRRPFMVMGTLASLVGFVLLQFASSDQWPKLYMLMLILTQLGLNVAFAAQCGLPADLQDQEENQTCNSQCEVSSFVALHSFLGSLVAVGALFITRDMPLQVIYSLYVGALIVFCICPCMSVSEAPGALEKPQVTWDEIRRSYWLSPRDDANFMWVCIGRMFYYMSTSVVVFLYYYIKDMFNVSEVVVKSRLAILIVSAQLSGACATWPAGQLSMKLGKKSVIYLSCAVMAGTHMLFIIAPELGHAQGWYLALCAGVLYGVGSGAYLSVDYALALEYMPATKTKAEAFGLWGVAGFLGSTLGPVLGGRLLAGTRTKMAPDGMEEYSYAGFALLMLCLGCFMNVVVVLATSMIRSRN